MPYERRGRSITVPPNASARLVEESKAIKWDGAPLVCLTLMEERQFDDAFIIRPVSNEEQYNVGFVMGMVPVLKFFTRTQATQRVRGATARQVVSALDDLSGFLVLDGERNRIRQKLLRNLYVVEMLIEVLQAPFEPYNTSSEAIKTSELRKYPETNAIIDATYNVLRTFLLGDSRKNELYIAQHIPFFQSQVGCKLGVESMYTELVRDNSQLVKAIGEHELDIFMDLLSTDKQHDYMDFLAAMCECEGGPLPDKQNYICENLFAKGRFTCFPTRFESGRVKVRQAKGQAGVARGRHGGQAGKDCLPDAPCVT